MTGSEQGTRRMRHGRHSKRSRRAAAIGVAVATLAAVAAAIIGPVSSTLAATATATATATAPAGDASVTPTGWSPVPYENAQLSVPGSWLVETPQQLSCGFPPVDGMIFLGITPGIPKGYGCTPTASLAWILPAGKLPKGITHRKPTTVINGIPAYRLPSAKGSTLYLVPELGVRVGARGRPASRVLATLTRSPLDVVLRRGSAARVPAGWSWRQFGDVRFATPRSWSLQQKNQWSTCGTGLVPNWLLLVDATEPPLYPPCPYQFPTAADGEAQPGLTVVTGKYAAKSVGESYGSCQVRHGVKICLSSVTGQGLMAGVLIFSLSPPKHAATFFLLGLSGSGATARAVFDSVSAT